MVLAGGWAWAAPPPAGAQAGVPAMGNGARDAVTGRFDGIASPPSPEDRPEFWVNRKRWGLAVPGMMGGNILPMIFNEFKQPWKEISRTAPETWSIHWKFWDKGDWEYDDNNFFNNQLFHPIQGNFYYNAARSNGFNYWASTVFALVGSYLWECCGERRKGAWNDWANTTLGGAALGEMLYRTSSMMLDNQRRGLDRWGTEALILPLNAERFMARGVYRQWRDHINPLERDSLPGWSLSFASGLRDLGEGVHPLLDVELRHGDLLGADHPRPYDHFVVNAQFNGQNQVIGLIQVRGVLASWIWHGANLKPSTTGSVVKLVVSHVYDYLDSAPDVQSDSLPEPTDGYRYGAQSLSLGLVGGWSDLGFVRRPEAGLSVDFVPIGAVNSPYVYIEVDEPERERRYDFGLGGGLRAHVSFELPAIWSRLEASYRTQWLWVHNGSNNAGPPDDPYPSKNESRHRVSLGGVRAEVELDQLFGWITGYAGGGLNDIWLGGDWLRFGKSSHYTVHSDDHHSADQWRVLVRWEIGS